MALFLRLSPQDTLSYFKAALWARYSRHLWSIFLRLFLYWFSFYSPTGLRLSSDFLDYFWVIIGNTLIGNVVLQESICCSSVLMSVVILSHVTWIYWLSTNTLTHTYTHIYRACVSFTRHTHTHTHTHIYIYMYVCVCVCVCACVRVCVCVLRACIFYKSKIYI